MRFAIDTCKDTHTMNIQGDGQMWVETMPTPDQSRGAMLVLSVGCDGKNVGLRELSGDKRCLAGEGANCAVSLEGEDTKKMSFLGVAELEESNPVLVMSAIVIFYVFACVLCCLGIFRCICLDCQRRRSRESTHSEIHHREERRDGKAEEGHDIHA